MRTNEATEKYNDVIHLFISFVFYKTINKCVTSFEQYNMCSRNFARLAGWQ